MCSWRAWPASWKNTQPSFQQHHPYRQGGIHRAAAIDSQPLETRTPFLEPTTRFSANSSNHSDRSRNSVPIYVSFSVSAGSCDGLTRAVHSNSHFLLMRDAMQELLLPAILMSETKVQLRLKSLSINQGQRLARSSPCCIFVCHLEWVVF